MGSAAYTSIPDGKGIFPPEQVAELWNKLHQAPQQFGLMTSRWTLALIRKTVTWLGDYSLSGIWRILCALRCHYKRGQQQVFSPDPEYAAKVERMQHCLQEARDNPGTVITLFEDEFSFYRWPTVARVYAEAGRKQPVARLTPGYNSRSRVAIVLEAVCGKVLYRLRSQLDVPQMVHLLKEVRQAFPEAKVIYYIQDNWHNVHFHPKQVAAAESLGIHLIGLPVYAPWLNPTEKVGRKLRQEALHMHPFSSDWPALRTLVSAFLDQFANGSSELLRYVGLSPD